MAILRSFLTGVKALFGKEKRNREMDEELQGYLEAAAEEKIRRGMNSHAAMRQVRVEMGSPEAVKQKVHAAGWESTAEGLWQDARYSLRMMAKSPGFTTVAILSLALGIGANTAIFTLINDLILKTLPVREPQQLISFGQADGGGTVDGIGPGPLDIFPYDFYQQLAHYQKTDQQKLFQDICAYASFNTQVSVRTESTSAASRANGHLVSGNFFQVLGAEPLIGRAITPDDATAPGRNPVAVISFRYWQQVLAGDPAAVGRQMTINGTLFTIIGVMPEKFYGVDLGEESPDMWLPLTMQQEVMLRPTLLDPHGLFWLHLMGRRTPNMSLQRAQAWVTSQLQAFMIDREGSQLTAARRQEIQGIYVEVLPGDRGVSGLRDQVRTPLHILMGVVAAVLLIACANLANFLLAKAASREREISTRLALGSSRARIVRQMLTETLMLSLSGGAVGLAFAFWGTRLLIHFVSGAAPHTALEATPDIHVLAFTFGISLLTGLLFGIAPALQVSRIGVAPAFRSNARNTAGDGGRSARLLSKMLVTVQVTLSLVLLAGAGLFLRTLHNLRNVDFGFNRSNVLVVTFNPKFAGYKPEQLNGLYDRLLDRLNALPGVRSATISGGPPISRGNWNSPIFVEGHATQRDEDITTLLNRVGPRYFETLGIPLLRGRTIGTQDTASSTKVVVVNQTLANQFFPKGDAIGHRFKVADPAVVGEWEIVGVVRDAKYNGPRERPHPMAYLALEQLTGDDNYAYFMQLQTTGDPAKMTGEMRQAVAEIDANLPILDVRTIGEQVDARMGQEAMISQLSTFFSLLALALACIGLYGVMTYNVVRRTNEIGIRLTLGAQTGRVLWMVLRESLLLLGIGVAVGIPATLAVSRMLQSQLFGLSAWDPLTLLAAVFVISTVTLISAYFPARRATKVDPMVALRYE